MPNRPSSAASPPGDPLEPGHTAPDFTLPDGNGRPITLSAVLRDFHAVLYFVRAYTWTYCLNHIAQLGRMHREFLDQGTSILTIGPSDQATANRIAATFETPFSVLADPERSVYTLYGYSKAAFVVQRSGTIVVDTTGVVRTVHRTTDPRRSLMKRDLRETIASLSR